MKERTTALEGRLSIKELLTLYSSINNSVNASWYKPAGSDLWTIDFCARGIFNCKCYKTPEQAQFQS